MFGFARRKRSIFTGIATGLGRAVPRAWQGFAVSLIATAALAGCANTGDPEAEDGGKGLRFRIGLAGLGVAVEIVGPEGKGVGLALSGYPVTREWSKLPQQETTE